VKRFDKRTVAFGLAAAAAVATAVLVTVTGRGSSESKAHRSVSAYVKEVDGVQQELRVRLTPLLTAYRDFSTQKPGSEVERKVRDAENTLGVLERRVARLDPPPEAARLHRLLLQLLAADRLVAHELVQLTVFAPRFRAALAVAGTAGSHLSAALDAARAPTPRPVRGTAVQIARARAAYRAAALASAVAQSDAVLAYCRELGRALVKLRALRPPPVMAPALRAQVTALVATRHTGLELGQELRKTDLTNVPMLSHRFSAAARAAGSVASQRAEIAAIKAYNGRVRETSSISGRIRDEVSRVQQLVG
jgi:hypothetical protein